MLLTLLRPMLSRAEALTGYERAMKRITAGLKAPKKLALALFVAIVVVAVAQISWWILFQITISREQEQLYTKVSQNSATLVATMLNHSYDRLISDATAIAGNGNPHQVRETFDELLGHPAVRATSSTMLRRSGDSGRNY